MEKSKKVNVDLRKFKDAKKLKRLFILVFPGYYAGWRLFKHLQEQGKINKDDAQNVKEIIKAGAKYNVDEMTIKLNRENSVGIEIKGLETEFGVNIAAGMRGNETYEMKIKY